MHSRLVEFADHYWAEYLQKITLAIDPLGEEQIAERANAQSNSIANLLAHLQGNLAQWILQGVGDEPFERRRSEEFAAAQNAGKSALLAALTETVEGCREVVKRVSTAELARMRRIQTYEVDGYAAIFHAVEHMSYHTGQIVLLAKAKGAALDFYPQHRGE